METDIKKIITATRAGENNVLEEKADGDSAGVVMYDNGLNIMPVDYAKLIFKEDGKKLLFLFNVACPIELKEIILDKIKN